MGTVPEQVRRSAERAAEIQKSLIAPAALESENPAEPPVTPDPGTAAPPETPASLEQPASTDTPAEPSTPAEPAAPATPPAPAPSPDDKAEQRYRTLQGILASEQRRWEQERKSYEERLSALEAAPRPAPAAPPAAKPLVTDQDIETYGPELVDLIGRKAREQAAEIVAEARAKWLEELKPQLENTQAQVSTVAAQVNKSAGERFMDALAKEVPDWQEVNADGRWLQWLGEVDPLSGVPRQAYLTNAQENLDVVRAARLFKAFKQTIGAPAAPTTPASPPAGKPQVSPSPRTVGNATAPTHREPDTSVSTAEINAHYRRSASDRTYRETPEYAQEEKRIAQAMASGKITG